jgi:hypothetical protein
MTGPVTEEGDRRMAEQSGEPRVAAEVGEELITLIVPDVDPEFVQLILGGASRSAAGGRADHEGRPGEGKPRAGLLQEHMELLALIRDTGIDRARLRVILGLDPEARPAGEDPHPPTR